MVGVGDVGGMGTIVGACHLLPPLPLQGDVEEVGDEVAVGAHLLPLPLPLVGDMKEVGDAVGGIGSVALSFPNCRYSLSNLPPFPGDPIGPTVDVHNRDSAAAYFALFFDNPLHQHIADQTNLYARVNPFQRSNYQWQDTSVDELRTFLGIFIATGLVSLPNLQDYWETDSIFSQPSIVKGMSRN